MGWQRLKSFRFFGARVVVASGRVLVISKESVAANTHETHSRR